MKFAALILIATAALAADTITAPKNSGRAFLSANDGNMYPLAVGYTTNGNSTILTINGATVASDNITIPQNSGYAYLTDNASRLLPLEVLMTTDGNGNVVPITGGGGGTWGSITGTLSNQTDLQSALSSKEPSITSGTSLQYWRGDKSFQTLNTAAVPESGNLYYTQTRFDSAFGAKSTSNLSEGSKLYYTDVRVQSAAKNGVTAQELWVAKDVGNDTYDGSLLQPFKTIGAAVTAANLVAAYYKQVIIHVAPVNNGGSAGGNYNENISLTQQGVNLVCDQSGALSRTCQVGGTLTVNLTGTSGGTNFIAASNEVTVSGFVFTSGASDTVTFSGSTFQRLIAMNCYFQAAAAHAAVVTNSGTSGGTPSQFRSYDSVFENSSASLETVTLTAGRFWLYGTTGTIQNDNASGPSFLQNGASDMTANLVQFTGQYNQTSNTATATFNLSTITSGAASCIATPSSPNTGYVLLAYFGCNSSNTNSITGTGVVVNSPGNVRFGSSGDIVSTVTQSSLLPLPQGEALLGAGASTGTNVMLSVKGGHVKVAQTTAPTASPSANAGTSATCTLSNATDSSGIINLTTGSGSWSSGTQCTITFNKAYGVAPICVFSANNANAAAKAVSQQINMTTTTTTLLAIFGAVETAGTAYKLSYHCEESQ